MRILFDLSVCQPIGESKFHGGGVYGYIVLTYLIGKVPNNLVIYLDKKRFIETKIKELIVSNKIQTIDLNEGSLLECIKKYDIEIFYSPLFNKSYNQLTQSNIPIVITIHGLRNLEMNRDKTEILYAQSLRDKVKALLKQTPYYKHLSKKYWKEKKWLFENKNVHIITVSNHSKNTILYYYPFANKGRIQVMYSVSTTPSNYKSIKPFTEEKYYLIVSANRWLKNAYRAIKAFDKLFDNNQYGILGKVIVLGLSKDSSIYKSINNKEKFQLMGYVSQDTLESLFKGAYALVYPSLNEGFGYPPLEAMKYGTPVIASPFASITEVCGDAVLYSNPYSVEEIASRILALEDEKTYESYKTKGIDRYKDINTQQTEGLQRLLNMFS